MPSRRVVLPPATADIVRSLPPETKRRVRAALAELERDPGLGDLLTEGHGHTSVSTTRGAHSPHLHYRAGDVLFNLSLFEPQDAGDPVSALEKRAESSPPFVVVDEATAIRPEPPTQH